MKINQWQKCTSLCFPKLDALCLQKRVSTICESKDNCDMKQLRGSTSLLFFPIVLGKSASIYQSDSSRECASHANKNKLFAAAFSSCVSFDLAARPPLQTLFKLETLALSKPSFFFVF